MATTQLSDIYNPLVFAAKAQEAQLELNKFITSGVMVMDADISASASNMSNVGELPFFKPLTIDEPNYSTDDPATNSVAGKVTDSKMIYRKAMMNKSWSVMDLSRELGLIDPVGAITGRIGQYWATNDEKRLITSCRGVIADNIANDGGDMINDISVTAGGTVGDVNKIDSFSVLDTLQTLGDHSQTVGAIAMHSIVLTSLKKQNLIDYIPNSQGVVNIPVYMNMTVIEDDSLVGISYDTDKVYYDTIFFGMGQFAGGEGAVPVASEIYRNPSAGNGGGEEIIYSRRSSIIHPYGCSFTSSSVAGQSATQAELAEAANWDRVYNRKNIALAVLRSNG